MPNLLDAIYSDLTTLIETTWPEVVPNGVITAEHTEFIPYEDMTVPFAVIACQSMPHTPDWSANSWCYLVPMEVYYICAVSGPVAGIREKLESLRDALGSAALSSGQVVESPDLSWDNSLPVNVQLIEKTTAQRAGRVAVSVLTAYLPG